MKAPSVVQDLANAIGGNIEAVGACPDGSGWATMSFPLPKDHWLTAEGDNVPPMPFRLGTEEHGLNLLPKVYSRDDFASMIRVACRYACRASTMNGKEMDFDPDAMCQNMIVGMLGYWTPNGLSSLDGHDETQRTTA